MFVAVNWKASGVAELSKTPRKEQNQHAVIFWVSAIRSRGELIKWRELWVKAVKQVEVPGTLDIASMMHRRSWP